jgi:hypothetical protein
MSKWIEITDDPATLPPMGQTVIVRMNADSGGGGEMFGLRYWQWHHSKFACWNTISQLIETVSPESGKTPTHWKSIQ